MYVTRTIQQRTPRERIRSRKPIRNPIVYGPARACRWIADAPNVMLSKIARHEEIYCGLPSVDRSSYCREHLARVYVIRERGR